MFAFMNEDHFINVSESKHAGFEKKKKENAYPRPSPFQLSFSFMNGYVLYTASLSREEQFSLSRLGLQSQYQRNKKYCKLHYFTKLRLFKI